MRIVKMASAGAAGVAALLLAAPSAHAAVPSETGNPDSGCTRSGASKDQGDWIANIVGGVVPIQQFKGICQHLAQMGITDHSKHGLFDDIVGDGTNKASNSVQGIISAPEGTTDSGIDGAGFDGDDYPSDSDFSDGEGAGFDSGDLGDSGHN